MTTFGEGQRTHWPDFGEITETQMTTAMAEVPETIRSKLAEGPHPRRWTCGVCLAFGEEFYRSGKSDRSDPIWIAYAYHELPKLEMIHKDDQWYGEHANEVYRRCLATYRAAGWKGEAREANA